MPSVALVFAALGTVIRPSCVRGRLSNASGAAFDHSTFAAMFPRPPPKFVPAVSRAV